MDNKLILWIMGMVILIATVQSAVADTESDLQNKAIAIYNFDTDYTDSLNGYNLTPLGNMTLNAVHAKFGTGGLNFSGGYIIHNNTVLNSPFNFGFGAFSVVAWVRWPSGAGGGNPHAVLSKTQSWGNNGYWLYTDVDSHAGDAVWIVGANANNIQTTTQTDTGQYVMLVGIRNSTDDSQLYFNGTKEAEKNLAAINVSQPIYMALGTDSSSLGNKKWLWEMDEVYFFNGTITQTEITWLLSNQLTAPDYSPTCTGLQNRTWSYNGSHAFNILCSDDNLETFYLECQDSNYTQNTTGISSTLYNFSNSTRFLTNQTCSYAVCDINSNCLTGDFEVNLVKSLVETLEGFTCPDTTAGVIVMIFLFVICIMGVIIGNLFQIPFMSIVSYSGLVLWGFILVGCHLLLGMMFILMVSILLIRQGFMMKY